MARAINKLSARAAETLSKPGRHSDGGGLYLSISGEGRRRRDARNAGKGGPDSMRTLVARPFLSLPPGPIAMA
jgi:hypothetical protein